MTIGAKKRDPMEDIQRQICEDAYAEYKPFVTKAEKDGTAIDPTALAKWLAAFTRYCRIMEGLHSNECPTCGGTGRVGVPE